MYGLVNKAIHGLVVERFGEPQWQAICAEAGIDNDCFISLDSYPDEISYALVGAASTQLDIPAEILLEEFGKYWVLYTANEGYGEMMAALGNSLPDFLSKLDEMHTRMTLIMPELRPPSFACESTGEQSLKLTYRSQRAGLTPMVVGLIKGLGERFDTSCAVELVEFNESSGTEAVFNVSWSDR